MSASLTRQMFRTTAPRLLGLGVAAIVTIAATQLLLLSFEVSPLVDPDRVGSISEWIRDRPRTGVAVLSGIAICLVALLLGWFVARGRRSNRSAVVTRRRDGSTRIDRRSLEASIERALDPIDRRVEVQARIRRRSVRLHLTTPDVRQSGSGHEYGAAFRQLVDTRGLPVRLGRVTVAAPRRTNRARTVR